VDAPGKGIEMSTDRVYVRINWPQAILLALVILGSIGLTGAWLLWRTDTGPHIVITDPARYAEVRMHFPERMVPFIPSAIPDGATNIAFRFEYRGGMGPSNSSMTVEFSLASEQARHEYLHLFSPGPPDWQVRHDPDAFSVEYIGGDQLISVRVDPVTDRVLLRVSNN
jgi:hypothetical protein